jgi:hypothetical protein
VKRREFITAVAATSAVATTDARRPLTITLLGTGTPSPSLTRQSSGYLIEVGRDLIVWDHGPGAYHRLLEPQPLQHVVPPGLRPVAVRVPPGRIAPLRCNGM